MDRLRRFLAVLLVLVLLPACVFADIVISAAEYPVTRDGWYSTLEEVSVYLASYKKLPGNYITKNQARDLGWNNTAGNLWKVADGRSIGGDRYGNYEGLLPDRQGRTWKECDIGYSGGYRGGKRIIYSSDGLIYYTGDHYSSFEQVRVVFAAPSPVPTDTLAPVPAAVEEDGLYTDRDLVAAYLHEYWGLPANYITKEEARQLGWSNKKDNLGTVAPGYTIGGDEFENREGLLPSTPTRTWYECDVNRSDGKRSSQRLVYSSDGLIYYTEDGFRSFELLYDGGDL